MTETAKPADAEGGKTFHLSGDFRGAIVNIESTFVGAAQARDVEGQPPEPGEPPYKGLRSYDEADADDFVGRELLTARLVGRLGSARFLAVIGASGSGKSSVVRAGVIPALRRGVPLADGSLPFAGADRWLIHLLTPTAHPLEALAASLLRDGQPAAAVTALGQELATATTTLSTAARQTLARAGRPHLLLVIDQFEEVFSLCRQESERRAFIDNLVAAAGSDAPVTTVIVLRADFYAQCAQYDGLRELVSQHQEYIGAMSRDELFRAIVQPAARGDWKLQEGLVEVMLDDVGDEPGALPLLSHALLETWTRRRGRTMTLSAYTESGGVRGAIARTAETVFQQRLTPAQRPVARAIFLRLTELGHSDDDTPDTRRRAQFSELITRATDPPMLEAVLDILVDSRLVLTGVAPPDDTKIVEVAHEALIREWPTLRGWLDHDREALIRHRQLTQDVNDWLKLERDPGALYRGARLAQTLAWTADSPEPLSVAESEFLDASRAAAEEEAQRARRLAAAARNQRILVGVAVVLLLAAVGAVLNSLGVFDPPAAPDRMDGDFNLAVAEFAVLDEAGRLTNDSHDGGLRVAQRVGAGLQRELADRPEVLVWYDSPELLSEHNVEIGVVAPPPLETTDPAEAAEALNADMVIHGVAEPSAGGANLVLRFHLRPQFGADLGQMVGNYEFTARIPVFDATDPAEEVWRELDPLANALAWLSLGLRQQIIGEQAEAIRSFERAAEFAPDSDVIQYFLGQEHFYSAQRAGGDEAQLAAAEAAFAEALRLNPDNARARIGQGSVHFVRAQRLLNAAEDLPAGEEREAALEAVQAEAEAALDAYTPVAGGPEQIETYGVPVASIARLGQGISLRVLSEVAELQGDLTTAESHIDRAIAALEHDLERFDTANDPRLAAQTYQALGSFYQWKTFLLSTRGATDEAIAARDTALAYFNDCVRQGEAFPIDTYMVETIVEGLCVKGIDALLQPAGGE